MTNGNAWRAGAAVMLVLAVLACSPGASTGGAAAGGGGAPARGAAAAPIGQAGAPPEKKQLRIGLPVSATSFLPVFLAQDRTFADEGLQVEVLGFRGDAEVVQALAADSVDLNVGSLNGLISMIEAGQDARGFYAGFNQADFEWYSKPEVKSWADLRGRSVGVTTYGSLTDFLTRYALRKHGLVPEVDVQVAQVGASPALLQAMRAGRIDGSILSAPTKWQAGRDNFNRLGVQTSEVGAAWPKHIFYAKERFLNDNPNTARAVLRAHVAAIRMAKADRSAGVDTLVKALKYEPGDAEAAYDDVIAAFDERGLLPTQWMPVFWEIAIAAGDVTEPWPEERLLDRRFVDSFGQWAPK